MNTGPPTQNIDGKTICTLYALAEITVVADGNYQWHVTEGLVGVNSDGHDGIAISGDTTIWGNLIVTGTTTSVTTIPKTLVNANYSVLSTDGLLLCTAGSGITLTLPDAANVTGHVFYIKQTDTGTGGVTIAMTNNQTIDTSTSYQLVNKNQFVQVVSDSSNWQVIGGN